MCRLWLPGSARGACLILLYCKGMKGAGLSQIPEDNQVLHTGGDKPCAGGRRVPRHEKGFHTMEVCFNGFPHHEKRFWGGGRGGAAQ